MTRGRLIRQTLITREQVRAKRSTLFVFGDNMARQGYGGQAAAMRGEPNAIGVPTKHAPARHPRAYFTDADWQDDRVRDAIASALDRIEAALAEGRDVVIPADGLGTGLADLPRRAPRIHVYIDRRIKNMQEVNE